MTTPTRQAKICTKPRRTLTHLLALTLLTLLPTLAKAQTPTPGSQIPNFTASTPLGVPITLSDDTAKGTTVLIILRGYPGCQCPYCVKQVHDFVEHAPAFAAKKTSILFVYPGPPPNSTITPRSFLAQQASLPANIQLVTDPDYKVTNLYNRRWDKPAETAYPSTFILARGGTVLFAKVSKGHGDRTSAEDILSQLPGN